MANEIKDKFGAATALTIALASLASSTAGVGRQSTLVDNSSAKFSRVILNLAFKVNGSSAPTANSAISIYLLRFDAASSPTYATDGAGVTDNGLTVKNAMLIGTVTCTATTTAATYYGDFVIDEPGPYWAIAVVQATGQTLNASGHIAEYTGVNPEVQ